MSTSNVSPVLKHAPWGSSRGRLFRKYLVSFVALASAALIVNVAIDAWLSFQEQNRLLTAVQHEKADSAAGKIAQFIGEIEQQIGWLSHLPRGAFVGDDQRLDAIRLLRVSPAIAEVAQLASTGRERLRVSRRAMDVVGSGQDLSGHPAFRGARANGIYYGPVEFFRETEPFMTIATAGAGNDSDVIVAEVNLRFIWDLVASIKVGTSGKSYVLDAGGRLIAHPDLWPALRNIDLSGRVDVRAALSGVASSADGVVGRDLDRQRVLSVYAPVKPLGWLVFVELPLQEAFAPIYGSIARSILIFAVVLACAALGAWFLSRRMIFPIQELTRGAARIGGGDMAQRLTIKTGDEFQALGEQFNQMAEHLSDSYATLERKVAERTAELAQARDQALAERAAAQHARQAAEDANAAKSRFLAVASHELRTPLNGVMGVLQLLDNGKLDDTQLRQLQTAFASGDTLLALIDTILEYARLEAGTEMLERRRFELHQLIESAIDLMRPQARAKGLDLVIATDASVAGYVYGDPVRLNRILLNLLGNAIKFTMQGQIVITATVERSEARALLHVAISDTGIGIAPAMQERIFEDFVQADDSIARRFGGTGLGLAISRRLARIMDGDLIVESVSGTGSTFRLSIPLAPAEDVLQAVESNVQDKPLTVLLVDDDPVNRDVGAALLRRLGHQPTVVADGASAISLARSGAFDAILMDLHMPDMDGIAAVEQIRKLPLASMPRIIALTADMSEPSRERFTRSGIDAVVSKPVLLGPLRVALARHLDPGGVPAAHDVPAASSALIDEELLTDQQTLLGAARVRDLKQLFERTSAVVLAALELSALANDWAAVQKSAHQLGGSASALALARLAACCALLEADAPSMSRDGLQAAVAELIALRAASLAGLDERLDRADGVSAPLL